MCAMVLFENNVHISTDEVHTFSAIIEGAYESAEEVNPLAMRKHAFHKIMLSSVSTELSYVRLVHSSHRSFLSSRFDCLEGMVNEHA